MAVSTRELILRLRVEGWRITQGYLSYLLRDSVLPEPPRFVGAFCWEPADVGPLAPRSSGAWARANGLHKRRRSKQW